MLPILRAQVSISLGFSFAKGLEAELSEAVRRTPAKKAPPSDEEEEASVAAPAGAEPEAASSAASLSTPTVTRTPAPSTYATPAAPEALDLSAMLADTPAPAPVSAAPATPATSGGGGGGGGSKLAAASREELLSYVQKQAIALKRSKAQNEELLKANERLVQKEKELEEMKAASTAKDTGIGGSGSDVTAALAALEEERASGLKLKKLALKMKQTNAEQEAELSALKQTVATQAAELLELKTASQAASEATAHLRAQLDERAAQLAAQAAEVARLERQLADNQAYIICHAAPFFGGSEW